MNSSTVGKQKSFIIRSILTVEHTRIHWRRPTY